MTPPMFRLSYTFGLLCLFSLGVFAQADDACKSWKMMPQGEQNTIIEKHVLYRDAMKMKDYKTAYPLWQAVYNAAPAADGERPFHYTDGREIYLDMYANETDPAKKAEYAAMVAKLYEQERQCYPGNEAQSLGLQVYDMFYTMQTPYADTYPIAKEAMKVGGNKTDFRVITPIGYLVSYMFSNKLIDQAEARQMIEQARGIVAANEAGPKATDYLTAQEAADQAIAAVERNVFDCEYFKAKLEPVYRANPDDPETYQDVYTQLLQVGCDKEDPLLAEIGAKDREFKERERLENNPMYAGNQLYETGDIDGALAKYEQAVEAQTSAESKAAIYLRMAQVYRSDKNSSSRAREYANKALEVKPGYGKAYMMIGDMYASSSRSCSTDPFEQRLVIIAALNKYAQAKGDPETADAAQDRINKYSGSLPTREMLFERGIKEGESRSTGCWIGETVSVRAAG